MLMRIGILSTHPIQYYAPLFRAMAQMPDIELRVYYAHRATAEDQAKAGFDVPFEWDRDLLEGYPCTFLKNESARPALDTFSGCDTPEIGRVIRRNRCDAFIVMGWHAKTFWQALWTCRGLGIPVFVRGDSNLLFKRPLLVRSAKKIFYPFVLRQFKGFFSPGRLHREYLLHYGVPPDRIYHVPHAVDNAWFKEKSRLTDGMRKEIRTSWGAGEHSTVILFVGKLIPRKRPLELVRALKILRARGIDCLGVFAGSGEMEKSVRDSAERLGVRIHLAGFINQTRLPAYYGASDLLVLPSDARETWGLVVNEAMACGLPAIVSDEVGCHPDLVDERLTGRVFKNGRPENLADAISDFLPMKNSPHVRETLEKKMQVYSIPAAARRIHGALMQNLCGKYAS